MKWLKSTTDKQYVAYGKIIPSMSEAPLAVNDSLYEQITGMKVISSLIKTGGIIVLDKYEQNNATEDTKKLQQLHTENARLNDEIRKLKALKADEEVAKKASQFDELKAEAEKALADKDAEIAELKAQLEAKKSKKKSEE